MLALAFHEFGGPEVLRLLDLAPPALGPGNVLVRVAAATINPTDLLMRAGKQVSMMAGLVPPFVAGMEFAGHVLALGPGAAKFHLGQRVMGIVNPRRPERGAHAEQLVAPEIALAALPASADLSAAATLPMNGLTAMMVMEALDLRAGASLLITGAAGAVGGYVIQLARHAGLKVIADAKDGDADLLRQLGADELVPRGDAMAPVMRERWPAGVDGLVDAALLGAQAAALVRDGGVAVTLRKANPITDLRLRVRHVSVTDRVNDGAGLEQLATWWLSGVLTPRVALRLPLSEGVQAQRLVEQGGLRGRVVLVCDELPR